MPRHKSNFFSLLLSSSSSSYHRFPFPWYPSALTSGAPPSLRLQITDRSTFLIMCDVPSRVVFVGNVLNGFLVLFTDISRSLSSSPSTCFVSTLWVIVTILYESSEKYVGTVKIKINSPLEGQNC
jgi:hypothetical protein